MNRIDEFEKAMNVVCGECGNTDGDQCDECWVKRSWRVMNGYPERRPPEMTWRDLMARIGELPEDVLDMPALVWVDPANKGADGECQVIDLSPYDADQPIGEGNRLCIDFR